VVSNAPNRIYNVHWSPSGSHLIYSARTSSAPFNFRHDVWRATRDGSGRTNLTADLYTDELYLPRFHALALGWR